MDDKQRVVNKLIGEEKFQYGWSNGQLVMEKKSLTEHEEKLLKEIEDIAFREMGERTRVASGDDQVYVNGLYNKLKKDNNSQILVRIVFRLCKQHYNL